MNDFKSLKIEFNGFYSFAIYSSRKDKGIGLEVVFASKERDSGAWKYLPLRILVHFLTLVLEWYRL
ncbi:hypothetical protein E4P47_09485 [Porphyromonas levii]|uniref:Uncharacterized protein n=1 Tax=Porphyromonas levii TaxID=28114 RepID=A0A4Y8WNW2_9PORP|nr:hypothetical protein E4P47_09485 [Porphyromonas levii]